MDCQHFDIGKLRDGDADAFTRLYEIYRGKLYAYLIAKTRGNEDLSMEILHETFCSAIESASTLKSDRNLGGWLFRIAHRRLMDHLRGRYREERYTMEKARADMMIRDERADDETGHAALLSVAMENIKHDYRHVLHLKYIEGKSQIDIARVLGKRESTVEGLLYRARRELKKEMMRLSE